MTSSPPPGFANYQPLWPIIGPPSPTAQLRAPLEGACPSEGLTHLSDAGRRPKSEDGLGFSIGANPSDRRLIKNPRPSRPAHRRVRQWAGMATNRRGRTSEAGPLRRSVPSVGRFSSEIRPQEPVPQFGESAPPPLHRLRRLMETGSGVRLLRETCSPSRLPSFPVAFCSSSAFLPMSCLEIWWRHPGFQTRPSLRRPHSPRSRLFGASDRCIGLPHSSPILWGPSPFPPIR